MGLNKGGWVMLVRNVRRVRFHFLIMKKLRTSGNVGKKGKKVIFEWESF